MVVNNIVCKVDCESKWNNSQPILVMRGFCKNVNIENNTAYIE